MNLNDRRLGLLVATLVILAVLAVVSLIPWWSMVLVGMVWGLVFLCDELNMWEGK